LIERPVTGAVVRTSSGAENEVTVPMGAYEIKTLRVVRKPVVEMP
jgi:hypothetical protein